MMEHSFLSKRLLLVFAVLNFFSVKSCLDISTEQVDCFNEDACLDRVNNANTILPWL